MHFGKKRFSGVKTAVRDSHADAQSDFIGIISFLKGVDREGVLGNFFSEQELFHLVRCAQFSLHCLILPLRRGYT